ncbi:folylpolyglutamate synthase, mitochondrial [Bradysia coprophila]|uniref:folylpolyglutamate synthase, mitochondrial n=1 Tax=Bradysia coprophila TaxID=38358 RepID=UPI00187D938A|nr:folylpolyglutamate synthase, mitochondrial [Bradysia coprophila]XP_037036194.1 folylpolyglutamate synthase, mitochondrial [Bradysia coprophila]
MLTVLTSTLVFVHRLCMQQHQIMVRSVSISSKIKNAVSEKQEIIGVVDTYEKAIATLNSLQSNATTLAHSIALRQHNGKCTQVQQTVKYLKRSGITCNELDSLSVIHVAGTKGKGSTCALTDSILSAAGVRTGFFSSPHLIHVTERIRINGSPVSRELFAKYFWKVYRSLDKTKEHDKDMPAYFHCLTLIAFHLFLAEKVDVVILEVGIGGEHDCTNVVRNTKTVAITSLGLEHTSILGDTLTDIAWQKSGIIKPDSDVFTVTQPDECMKVIRARCAERNAKLHIVPLFKEYNWSDSSKRINNFNDVQQLNASMAIQLSWNWLRRNTNVIKNQQLIDLLLEHNASSLHLNLTNEFVTGLHNFSWPGRFQVLQRKRQRLYIDGAHTIESLKLCLDWFKLQTRNSPNRKMLLFNVTGDRDAEKMLCILYGSFDCAMFSPNIPSVAVNISNDSYSILQGNNCEKCTIYANRWTELMNNNGPSSERPHSSAHVFNCIADVLSFLDAESTENNEEIDVLITGSLHLVGATLSALSEQVE